MKTLFKKATIIVAAALVGVFSSVPMASAAVCGNEYVVNVSSPYCEGKGCGGREGVMVSYQDYTFEKICVENDITFTSGRTERRSNGCC